MDRLAHALANRTIAWAVVLGVLGTAVGALALATKVGHEDDLLAFLPSTDRDVQLFHDLNRRFGGLDVALVGIAAEDVFSRDFVSRLKRVTRDLDDTPGLDRVLSLANLTDFIPDREHGGIITGPLVDRIPRSDAERRALRAKVLSRELAVGNLVAADGRAVMIYCFLAAGSDTKATAARIQRAVTAAFPENDLYWGGGPFISTYIYETTQKDMRRLTPWAVLAMVLAMMVAFRDLRGTCLALLSTSLAIVITLALMKLCGVRVNLALSSMPVILFAVGSAYGIHVLARYYALSRERSPDDALVGTLRSVGPTVLAAGLTTVFSLLSFVTMDLVPLRHFGLFTAIGVLLSLILALTFVPAVIALLRFRSRGAPPLRRFTRLLERVAALPLRHRALVGGAIGLVAAVGLTLTFRVSAEIEMSDLFARGSPPDRSERFMRKHFGGSQFLWVHVTGDLSRPAVLREVQWIADGMRTLPHVASTMQVGDALSLANEAMEGLRRLPDTQAKVELLYAMTSDDPSVGQLVSRDRRHALVQVKLSENDAATREELLARAEAWLADNALLHVREAPLPAAGGPPRASTRFERASQRSRALIAARVVALGHGHGQPLDDDARQRVDKALAGFAAAPLPAHVAAQLVPGLRRFLRSEECAVQLPAATADQDPALAVARAVAALGPGADDAALGAAVQRALHGETPPPQNSPEARRVEDLVISISAPLAEQWQRAAAETQARALYRAAGFSLRGRAQRQVLAGLSAAALDLRAPHVMLPAKAGQRGTRILRVALNGLPVLHRSLSRSTLGNQIKSVTTALLPVIAVLALFFRSLRTGLLLAAPTLLTLAVIYGGMGLLSIRLDLGTAMLASIILGTGVDYAVHFLAGWSSPHSLDDAARAAARDTGDAIWTNAVTVALGFGMLTLGEARPLQNVGGLTATAMIVAAVATFLVIPLLARRLRYRAGGHGLTLEMDSVAAQAETETLPDPDPSSASGRDR